MLSSSYFQEHKPSDLLSQVYCYRFNPQKSRHLTLRCLDAQLCCLSTISLLTVHCSLSRYMRSGALIPISDSVRASTICAAETSLRRAIESAWSSESTRHLS